MSDAVSFGVVIPTYGDYANADAITTLVARSEELGFDNIWFADRAAVPSYAAFCGRLVRIARVRVHRARATSHRVGTDVSCST